MTKESVSDKRSAKKSQILPFGFESHREIILHPVSIIVQINNIVKLRVAGLEDSEINIFYGNPNK